MMTPEEIDALRKGYAVAIDALIEVKETLAEGLGMLDVEPRTEAQLQAIMERAYEAAADGCSTDLRNPHGYAEAVKRVGSVVLHDKGWSNGRMP